MRIILGALACAFSGIVLAAPPPAPQITVAATDIRQLEFNWEPVSAVQRYELWFRAAPGAPWVKYRERPAQLAPRFRIGVAVHLLDWQRARYHVKACNPSGCSNSNQVGVDGQQLAAMGFIKPNAPTNHRWFGGAVAASEDGQTFAVLTSEAIGAAQDSATVHVYRKTTASSGWRREARLVPSTIQALTGGPYGDPLAISGDGNVLALGVFNEARAGTNWIGAVYLFRRAGTAWRLVQKIASQSEVEDFFGHVVKLDHAGRTLVISHRWHHGTYAEGTLEMYHDAENDGSDQFVPSITIPIPPTPSGEPPLNCVGIALSGDGQKILRGCVSGGGPNGYAQVLEAPHWGETARLPNGWGGGVQLSFDGTTALVEDQDHSLAWKLGPGGWVVDGRLHHMNGLASYTRPNIALSRDGKIAALGNFDEFTAGVGPVFPPYELGDESRPSGGVIIWERKPRGWVLRRLVKPGSTHMGSAGHSVALGDNGRLLIVGAPWDPSAATGIDGDREDDSAPERGAVWVY